MKQASLLYFELTLLLSLASFIWQLIKVKLGKQRFMLVASSVLATIVILSFLVVSTLHTTPEKTSPITEYTPPQAELYVEQRLTEEQIHQELDHWLAILDNQPSHRDVLLNVSNLYRSLGDDSNAIYYWERARKADPNNPLFK